jgi:hypothetical protein
MKKALARRLTPIDAKIFEFLWRWKLATPILLYEVLGKDKITFRNFWKKLRRLFHEGYLQIESGINDQDLVLYRLTKKGFTQVLKNTDYMPVKRFLPQSVYHDYLATSFQLLGFLGSANSQVHFFTEQEAIVNEVGQFPKWVPGRKEHIPDGYTMIQNKNERTLIALEVEISQKSQPRYLKVLSFFGGTKSEYDFVFWLVKTKTLAESILAARTGPDYMDLSKHQFFLLEDFIAHGWNTKCFLGTTKGKSLLEIYQVLLGKESVSPAGHCLVTRRSPRLEEIYFSKLISPKGYNKLVAKS